MTGSHRPFFIQLFRVLLPSWKFFDDIALMPVLWLRFSLKGERPEISSWEKALPKIQSRSWGELFINSRECELFAYHSLLDQFVTDREDNSDATVTLELVENLAAQQARALRKVSLGKPDDHFQYRITLGADEIFSSPWKELS